MDETEREVSDELAADLRRWLSPHVPGEGFRRFSEPEEEQTVLALLRDRERDGKRIAELEAERDAARARVAELEARHAALEAREAKCLRVLEGIGPSDGTPIEYYCLDILRGVERDEE